MVKERAARETTEAAAVTLQAAARGLAARRLATAKLGAITRLQACARGWHVRCKIALRSSAATDIQAAVRGGFARRRCAVLRQAARMRGVQPEGAAPAAEASLALAMGASSRRRSPSVLQPAPGSQCAPPFPCDER